jgi:fatty acid desaturase
MTGPLTIDSAQQVRIRWYRSPIDELHLAALMKRSDFQGLLHVVAHLILLAASGALAYWLYVQHQFMMALVVLFVHGTCYSFLGYAGAGHELAHRTVFKTEILNDIFLLLFAFLTWNNSVYFRASHMRHHRCTLFAELDGEVRLPQTFSYSDWLWALSLDLPSMYRAVRIVVENSFNVIKGEWGARLFPKTDVSSRRKVVIWARCVLIGHAVLATSFILTGYWPLLLLVTFAPFVADWLSKLLALIQHYGMQPNVDDFRLNSRTVLLNPFVAFLYWQMNYHVEHHMYPGVPFYNLKKLRGRIEQDLPPACDGVIGVLREVSAIKSRDIA